MHQFLVLFERVLRWQGRDVKAPLCVLGRTFASNEFLVDLSGRKNETGLLLKGQSFKSFLK